MVRDDGKKVGGADRATREKKNDPPAQTSPFPTTETSSTYLLGYDFGASCILARARRAFRGARGTAGRVAATWFSAGNHVRLDADADVGSRGITWGTLTLHDPADQANATAVNLIEREAGFVVRPFTAPSATAAFGGGVELGDSGWRLDAAFDLNALTPYASVSRSLAAGVGGPAFDGPATVGLHVAPADAVVMATFELGDKTGDADAGVAFGGGRGGRHPVKAFVRGRVAKGGGGGWRPAVRDASFGLMVEGWPFGGLF